MHSSGNDICWKKKNRTDLDIQLLHMMLRLNALSHRQLGDTKCTVYTLAAQETIFYL